LVLTGNPDVLTKLCESLSMPLALDESLQQPGALTTVDFALQRVKLGALVAKPMALGGIEPIRQLGALAERHHVPVILSHLFDGPLAWAGCAALALAFGSRTVAAGLAPHRGLMAWPTADLPGLEGAWLGPWSTPGVLP
jgi:L-alanine-DL-glutamate epimerase-like enolase superfamily enzyme